MSHLHNPPLSLTNASQGDKTPESLYMENGHFAVTAPLASHSRSPSDIRIKSPIPTHPRSSDSVKNWPSYYKITSFPISAQFRLCSTFSIFIHTKISCMILFHNLSIALSSQFLIICSYSNFSFTTINLFLVIRYFLSINTSTVLRKRQTIIYHLILSS